jgi:hypothetical protein
MHVRTHVRVHTHVHTEVPTCGRTSSAHTLRTHTHLSRWVASSSSCDRDRACPPWDEHEHAPRTRTHMHTYAHVQSDVHATPYALTMIVRRISSSRNDGIRACPPWMNTEHASTLQYAHAAVACSPDVSARIPRTRRTHLNCALHLILTPNDWDQACHRMN